VDPLVDQGEASESRTRYPEISGDVRRRSYLALGEALWWTSFRGISRHTASMSGRQGWRYPVSRFSRLTPGRVAPLAVSGNKDSTLFGE